VLRMILRIKIIIYEWLFLRNAHHHLSDVRTKYSFTMHKQKMFGLTNVNHTMTFKIFRNSPNSLTRQLHILYNYNQTIGGSKLGTVMEQVILQDGFTIFLRN
jgi:hypothetical protein